MDKGYSHPIDPGDANYASTNVPTAMASIGSGVVAGTLAAVDALGGVPAAAPGLLLGGDLGIPAFMAPALLTGPSMDMAIFIFAFLSVGLASLNLAHGFWLKKRELAAYAAEQDKLAKKAHEEEHAHQKEHACLVKRIRDLEEQVQRNDKTGDYDYGETTGTGPVAVPG